MTLLVVDAEQVARTWARTEPNISGVVGNRVFFATPQSYDIPPRGQGPPGAWIVIRLLTENHETDNVGFQHSVLEFTCWGKTKLLAGAAAVAVQQAGRSFLGAPVVVGSATIVSGGVFMKQWHPDKDTNFARYIVDLFLDIRGAEGPPGQ